MASVADFVKAPSEYILESCSKEQLVKISEHYKVDVAHLRLKDQIKSALKISLFESGLFLSKAEFIAPSPGLTFEQQKELLLLKYDRERELQE